MPWRPVQEDDGWTRVSRRRGRRAYRPDRDFEAHRGRRPSSTPRGERRGSWDQWAPTMTRRRSYAPETGEFRAYVPTRHGGSRRRRGPDYGWTREARGAYRHDDHRPRPAARPNHEGGGPVPDDPAFCSRVRLLYRLIKALHHLNNLASGEPPALRRLRDHLATVIKPAMPNADTMSLIEANAMNWARTNTKVLRDHYEKYITEVKLSLVGETFANVLPPFEIAVKWARKNLGRRLLDTTLGQGRQMVRDCLLDSPLPPPTTPQRPAVPRASQASTLSTLSPPPGDTTPFPPLPPPGGALPLHLLPPAHAPLPRRQKGRDRRAAVTGGDITPGTSAPAAPPYAPGPRSTITVPALLHPPPSSSALEPPQLPPPPSSSRDLVNGGAPCPPSDPRDGPHDAPTAHADMTRDLMNDLITMSDDEWPSQPLLDHMHRSFREDRQEASTPSAPEPMNPVLLSPRRLRSGNPPTSVARQPAGGAEVSSVVEGRQTTGQKRVK